MITSVNHSMFQVCVYLLCGWRTEEEREREREKKERNSLKTKESRNQQLYAVSFPTPASQLPPIFDHFKIALLKESEKHGVGWTFWMVLRNRCLIPQLQEGAAPYPEMWEKWWPYKSEHNYSTENFCSVAAPAVSPEVNQVKDLRRVNISRCEPCKRSEWTLPFWFYQDQRADGEWWDHWPKGRGSP